VFLGALGLVALAQVGLGLAAATAAGLAWLAVLLFLFFCGSNILEASQPSIASRTAPPGARGAALGFYNTLMSFGFFAGGAVGGLLIKSWGPVGLFAACAAAMAAAVWVALPMPVSR
jgi:predicted MFS family arabinose efflux permease